MQLTSLSSMKMRNFFLANRLFCKLKFARTNIICVVILNFGCEKKKKTFDDLYKTICYLIDALETNSQCFTIDS